MDIIELGQCSFQWINVIWCLKNLIIFHWSLFRFKPLKIRLSKELLAFLMVNHFYNVVKDNLLMNHWALNLSYRKENIEFSETQGMGRLHIQYILPSEVNKYKIIIEKNILEWIELLSDSEKLFLEQEKQKSKTIVYDPKVLIHYKNSVYDAIKGRINYRKLRVSRNKTVRYLFIWVDSSLILNISRVVYEIYSQFRQLSRLRSYWETRNFINALLFHPSSLEKERFMYASQMIESWQFAKSRIFIIRNLRNAIVNSLFFVENRTFLRKLRYFKNIITLFSYRKRKKLFKYFLTMGMSLVSLFFISGDTLRVTNYYAFINYVYLRNRWFKKALFFLNVKMWRRQVDYKLMALSRKSVYLLLDLRLFNVFFLSLIFSSITQMLFIQRTVIALWIIYLSYTNVSIMPMYGIDYLIRPSLNLRFISDVSQLPLFHLDVGASYILERYCSPQINIFFQPVTINKRKKNRLIFSIETLL